MGLRDGRRHIAILVTDGESNDRNETLDAAEELHAANVFQVYAAGVGNADIIELEAIEGPSGKRGHVPFGIIKF